jgi:CBS domain-containing protein
MEVMDTLRCLLQKNKMLAHKHESYPELLIMTKGEEVSHMHGEFESYDSIKKWKDEHILKFALDTKGLNDFHDEMMRSASKLALFQLEQEFGKPPCKYTWFVMGSGGRIEQGIISDQDHGLIYEDHTEEASNYFKKLGEELSRGLYHIGYPYCEGKIMSSNSMWCKSIVDWESQLLKWMEDMSWESIRYLQIFYDSRRLVGDKDFVDELKYRIFHYQKQHPMLLQRFMDNIQHIKHSVGPLGQLYVEPSGKYEGCIDLKKAAFLPYVNAIRLLAIKEGIEETSTLERFNCLCEGEAYREELLYYKRNFEKLLEYRCILFKNADSYDDVHYLNIKNLSKVEKREIKNILRDGKKLHQYVQGIIDKGCYNK